MYYCDLNLLTNKLNAPILHLFLGEIEAGGDLDPPGSTEVLIEVELLLEL